MNTPTPQLTAMQEAIEKIESMEKQVWKFELEIKDYQIIRLPKESEILTAQSQNGIPCIWALVKPNNSNEERFFELFGTGHNIHCDMGIDRKYIGTFQLLNGNLVYHLFERI